MKDSESYADALRIWMPVIQQYRGTPRAIKRFGNRLRYLAMLQQDTKYDESGFDVVPRAISRFVERAWKSSKIANDPPATPIDASTPRVVRESLLVALASLQEVNGAKWRESLAPTDTGRLKSAINKAVASYVMTPGATWPPDNATLDVFERLLKGVRIAEPTDDPTTTPP